MRDEGTAMSKNMKTSPTEPQQLSDEDLCQVSGGWTQTGPGFTAGGWCQDDEDSLQADYAAHGAGMSLDDFIKTRSYSSQELTCRRMYLQQQQFRSLFQ